MLHLCFAGKIDFFLKNRLKMPGIVIIFKSNLGSPLIHGHEFKMFVCIILLLQTIGVLPDPVRKEGEYCEVIFLLHVV